MQTKNVGGSIGFLYLHFCLYIKNNSKESKTEGSFLYIFLKHLQEI